MRDLLPFKLPACLRETTYPPGIILLKNAYAVVLTITGPRGELQVSRTNGMKIRRGRPAEAQFLARKGRCLCKETA